MKNRDNPARPISVAESGNGDTSTSLSYLEGGGLTKLEDLAMRLYQDSAARPDNDGTKKSLINDANWAISAANIFFDELEKSNNEQP